MKFVYVEVSHEDLLLVEEALLVNNSFNGLDVDPIAINTSSGILSVFLRYVCLREMSLL